MVGSNGRWLCIFPLKHQAGKRNCQDIYFPTGETQLFLAHTSDNQGWGTQVAGLAGRSGLSRTSDLTWSISPPMTWTQLTTRLLLPFVLGKRACFLIGIRIWG